ncbi:hypothetical protein FRC01_012425 [Tulasnella sp. 417]|nr:hypothetical protein FRC01_012425 [Tulasnella sp. 417]
MTNTGKSAIINSLLHEESQKIYRIRVGDDPNSRTTLHPHQVTSANLFADHGLEIGLIDTPGFTFKFPTNVTDEQLAELRTKETLFHRRALFEKMRYPFNTASWVLQRTNPDDIQVLYNTQAFEANDLEAMIKSLGRASGRLSKSGKTDKESTARMILRDWRQGKIGIYTLPPKSSLSTILSTTPGSSPFKDLYERTDSLVLDKLPTKAEMIAGPHGSSVVRFKVGEPWPGNVQVDLHARYDVEGEDGELNGLRMKKALANGDHMDVDEDSEEDEEDELDEDDEMEDGEDQSDEGEEEEWTGFASGNESDSASSGDQDSDSDEPPPPAPKSKSKRRASPNRPLEPVSLKASKSKKVAFASAKPAVAPPTSATSRLGSTKEAKPSKTSLKKANQEAAKERSRAAAAKSAASKPPAKSTTPVEKTSSLKVANEPSAARKKARAAAATTSDVSEQPYDFNLHFK